MAAAKASKEIQQVPVEQYQALVDYLRDPKFLPGVLRVINLIQSKINGLMDSDLSVFVDVPENQDIKKTQAVALLFPQHTGALDVAVYAVNGERLSLLLDSGIIDWKAYVCFSALESKFVPLVEQRTKNRTASYSMWQYNEATYKPIDVKALADAKQVKLGPLSQDDAIIVDDAWPYHSKNSGKLISRLVEKSVTCGVYFIDGGSLQSWGLIQFDGSIGMLYTIDSSRRWGFASGVMTSLVASLTKQRRIPFVFVSANNDSAASFFKKLGFQNVLECAWVYVNAPVLQVEQKEAPIKQLAPVKPISDKSHLPQTGQTLQYHKGSIKNMTLNSYCQMEGSNFNVRTGPDYNTNKRKLPSLGSIYDIVHIDAFRCDQKIPHAARYFQLPYSPNLQQLEAKRGKDSLYLPDLFIVHWMVPGYAPANPLWGSKEDGEGYTLTMIFRLTQETREQLNMPPDRRPACLPLLARFIDGDQDVRQKFKAITTVVNLNEAEFGIATAKLVERYNYTPFLIRTTSSFYSGENYFEIDIDVHRFSYLARVGLSGVRETLKTVVFDCAFVIQGDTDDELPEKILGAARLSKFDQSICKPFPTNNAPK